MGVKEADSKDEQPEPKRKRGKSYGSSTSESTQKITAGKESKIPIFKYREWPNNSSSSEPITVDEVTF